MNFINDNIILLHASPSPKQRGGAVTRLLVMIGKCIIAQEEEIHLEGIETV